MTRTQIYLPGDQKRLLKRIAVKEDTTVSHVVRELIELGMQTKKLKRKKVKKYKTAGEFLLSIAERAEKLGFSGPKDASINHDKYIYGLNK